MMRVPLILAVAVLSGCSAMSGFSGLAGSKSQLTCKAPDGVTCSSVSGNYANSLADNLPGQMPQTPAEAAGKKGEPSSHPLPDVNSYVSPRDLVTPSSGDPVRMAPLVLRVWFAPWEDRDGDLHDQHYVYTVVHTGKWLIDASRDAIANKYRPVFPLKGNAPAKEDPAATPEIPEGFGEAPAKPVNGAAE